MKKFITPLALKGTPVTIYQAQLPSKALSATDDNAMFPETTFSL
jgi:hypothetical protein